MKKNTLLCGIILVYCSVKVTTADEFQTTIRGTCKYQIYKEQKSFWSAQNDCIMAGGSLAMPNLHESRRIHSGSNMTWIGGIYFRNWKWMDGRRISLRSFLRWQIFEESWLSLHTRQECLVMYRSTYSVANCSASYPYICEIPVSNPCENRTCMPNDTCTSVGCYDRCRSPRFGKANSAEIVYRAPRILSVNPNSCNNVVTLIWIPASFSLGVRHRITAVPSQNQAEKNVEIEVIPTNLTRISQTITNLSSKTAYNLKITVCSEQCDPILSAQNDFISGPVNKLPNKIITNVSYSNSLDESACNIRISARTFTSIIGFKITVISSSKYQTADLLRRNTIEFTTKFLSHDFPTAPNTKYEISVAAFNCIGVGRKVIGIGSCDTMANEPKAIPPPVIQYNDFHGTYEVSITPFNEETVLASCYFVVLQAVCIETSMELSNMYFTRRDFMNAAKFTEEMTELVENKEYIAVAIKSSEFSKSPMKITLGNDAITKCDVLGIFSENAREQSYIKEGRNFPLIENHIYKAFVVVSTPISPTDVMYNASEIVEIQIEAAEGPHIVIIALLALLGIAITIAVVVRRRRSRNLVHGQRNQPNENMCNAGPAIKPVSTSPVQTESLYVEPIKISTGNYVEMSAIYENLPTCSRDNDHLQRSREGVYQNLKENDSQFYENV